MAPKFESRHWINNEFVDIPSKETYTIRSPYDDHEVGSIPLADESIVDSAVGAARAAFETGPWSTFTGPQRAACMLKLADLIDAKAAEIAEIEAASVGQPAQSAQMIVGSCTATYRYYAGWADKIVGESHKEENESFKIVQYEPFGVCAGIAAWNATMLYVGWKIAPALAAGNTFVFKSSEKSPFAPLLVAPLFKEAGFPPGVVNFISGGGLTGALLSAHMDIDKISFTGSGVTGRKVQDAAAKSNLKKVTLELGGKSPAVIFDDANLENAVAHNSQMFLFNTGQVCAATSRVFVQKSIAPKFIEAVTAAFKGAEGAFGQDPALATTMLGPVADKLQYDRVMEFIAKGKESSSGAELLVGGNKIEGQNGLYIQPTVFLNAKDDAQIYREEIFGPVLNIRTFETEEEAVKMANDTAYGLSSAVYTGSTSRALRVASKIRAGTVGINGVGFPSQITPFGGYKQSGYGRELGKPGLMAYLQEKTIMINMGI